MVPGTRRTALALVATAALMLAYAVAVLVIAAPGKWPSLLARGYGHMTYAGLGVVLLSTAWAWFHRGTALARVVAWRKQLGLATVLCALGHFGLLFWGEPRLRKAEFEWSNDGPGLLALSMLLVLAATTPDAVRKRMGQKRWKRVHALTFVAFAITTPAALAAIGRGTFWLPLSIALLVVGYRGAYLVSRVRRERAKRSASHSNRPQRPANEASPRTGS